MEVRVSLQGASSNMGSNRDYGEYVGGCIGITETKWKLLFRVL